MDRQERGRRGEAAAAKYYLDRGCRLLAHGYRTRQGELDLILEDRGVIVVAEVKTRGQRALFSGAEAVDTAKQRRILLAAKRYLQQNGLTERQVRFDVVEVGCVSGGYRVHCIKNAFEAGL